jgi:radical SAM superfamily enzyme YgiQ (UPF0313 family)
MSRVLLAKPDLSFGIEISPPLGLCYLAAVAREAGHEARILDLRIPGQGADAFDRSLREWRPDVVGFSAFSYEADAVRRLARKVREALPAAKVLIGGPLASADPEAALADGTVDVAVLGEGERTLVDLLARFREGRDVLGLSGTAVRDGGGVSVAPIAEYIEDLDALPLPAWDLIDMAAYSRVPRQGFLYKHRNYFPVFSSRGCPFRCIYCHNVFGKRFRPRSPEGVLKEIGELVAKYGVREIHFIDDIFNFRKDRAVAILQGIIDRGWDLALSYPNGIRGDLLDEPFIDLMKRAGTYKVSVAIEAGTERMQRLMRKNLKFEAAREAIGHLVRRRILTHAFFMAGFPTETRAEALATAAFSRTIDAHSASFFIVNPFKGTELAAMAAETGKRDASTLGASNYFDPRVADLGISEVAPDELRKIVRRATRDFYLRRPARVWRVLRDVPRKRQLLFLAFLVLTRAFVPGAIRLERRLLLGRA